MMIHVSYLYQLGEGRRVSYRFNGRIITITYTDEEGKTYEESVDFSSLGVAMDVDEIQYDYLPFDPILEAYTDERGDLHLSLIMYADSEDDFPPEGEVVETMEG